MSESLRDRVGRVLWEAHTSDGRRAAPAEDTAAMADALIAAGLVAEPRERVRDSEVLDRMGDRVGPNDYPLADLIYDAASRMRRNENEQEAPREAL